MMQPWVRCFRKSSSEAAFKASYQPFKKKKNYYSIVTLHFSTKNGTVLAEARACTVELVSSDLTVYTVGYPWEVLTTTKACDTDVKHTCGKTTQRCFKQQCFIAILCLWNCLWLRQVSSIHDSSIGSLSGKASIMLYSIWKEKIVFHLGHSGIARLMPFILSAAFNRLWVFNIC